MKPYQITLINAIVLLAIGLWGYLHPGAQRSFALIPVAFGLLFLTTTPLFRSGNLLVAYMVSTLTLLLVTALAISLVEALQYREFGNIFRLSLMSISSAIAVGIYFKAYLLQQRARSRF
ncbi:MAG: hypothetical protein IPH04_01965 [Saprospirales bacterium]|jgi:hypothetical protein|nr:hypothetical protein [Saprospirales bacterium]MBK6901599.1 hypothetical protein [Saprospirales bacterium]MBK7335515.1 hypothetical protein [Saprospirales bacterium]